MERIGQLIADVVVGCRCEAERFGVVVYRERLPAKLGMLCELVLRGAWVELISEQREASSLQKQEEKYREVGQAIDHAAIVVQLARQQR